MLIEKADRIVVTGGKGFLGQVVCKRLKSSGYTNIVELPGSRTPMSLNLIKSLDVAYLFQNYQPSIVIHLAARVGGIGANKANPGSFFYENMVMGLNLIEEARKHNCKKFLLTSTVCSYPKFTPVPFKEEDLWNGYPEETNAPYGIAKKALMEMLQAYRKQYGFNGVTLIPVNMYGPGDNFNPDSSHVIPALILKFKQAKANDDKEVVVWGSGKASREFLYVDDCADAIVMALEQYEDPHPVNIGTGKEITIKELATRIAQITGYKGKIVFDSAKPDGQPRRCLDVSVAESSFGFKASVGLKEGLENTIAWFNENNLLNSYTSR
jgi:GDP-L-fucose synthase